MTVQDDFTEAAYGQLLDAAMARFRFVDLAEPLSDDAVCLWRHDIDMSPHRAYRLANMEAERGLQAHYFVMFGSLFYNAFEPAVTKLLRQLPRLGHSVGLHFCPAMQHVADLRDMEDSLMREANALSALIDAPVTSFTLHNPTAMAGVALDQLHHGALLNASAPALVGSFTYCSDSNGLWRHRRLDEVVEDNSVTRLYALTHPEWWTPDAMSPRARIQRCIDGRAARVGKEYDEDIASFGRPNR